jgi:endonuclease YncB( thermonuclease family)
MADVFPFRRLRSGPLRALPRRLVLRGLRARNPGRILGLFVLAALLGGAALVVRPSSDAGAMRPTTDPSSSSPPRRLAVIATDGDSLRAGDERIRLIGVDAPELSQTCRDAQGAQWECGRAARTRMAALVARGTVACNARGRDRYGRTLAVCSSGDIADLGERLVREGYAVGYSAGDYAAAEREAKSAGRGIWAGSFERPQDWRRRNPRG